MFDFGTRPVQKRRTTLSVNLPIAWGRSEGVDGGDHVRILMTDEGFLLIAPADRIEIVRNAPGEGKQAPTSSSTPTGNQRAPTGGTAGGY